METVHRLDHDLPLMQEGKLTVLDAYCLFGSAADSRPTWGYCLEAARISGTTEILVLICTDETASAERACVGFHNLICK